MKLIDFLPVSTDMPSCPVSAGIYGGIATIVPGIVNGTASAIKHFKSIT
jgi:hypothetical protein